MVDIEFAGIADVDEDRLFVLDEALNLARLEQDLVARVVGNCTQVIDGAGTEAGKRAAFGQPFLEFLRR